ncbi:hypothetical protein [Rhizobium laguerreae]|uniref:hypothetical protein n=1 Tax=Rhizobium laguerreae TaxID=1076926 RepID=UPI001C90758A|nr:hypothetical protein [Rhizobium laguerreae]
MGKSKIQRAFSVAVAIGRRQPSALLQLPKTRLITPRFEGEAKNASRNNDEKIVC